MTMLVGDKPSDDTFALFVVTGGMRHQLLKKGQKSKEAAEFDLWKLNPRDVLRCGRVSHRLSEMPNS
jgi:hypothetical protein